MKKVILASGSPRRKELLELVEVEFSIISSSIQEEFDYSLSPEELAMDLALQKANDVAQTNRESLVIGADTIVVINGKPLGKPVDGVDAKKMLQSLSGRSHEVITGVAIVEQNHEELFFEKTEVTFWDLTDEEIEQYIKSGECFDKAGGYGIQGKGSIFVKEIKGDFYNVVGLPIARTVRVLRQRGIT